MPQKIDRGLGLDWIGSKIQKNRIRLNHYVYTYIFFCVFVEHNNGIII